MANTTNSTLTTNFNISPYYDDYDPKNQYYKILYKPGYAVQARELTQSQSMFQEQVSRFGKHVFKEGSIVLPGNFNLMCANTVQGPVQYVKVRDVDDSNNFVNIDNFVNVSLVGQTNNISSDVFFVLDGNESTDNTKTIYVNYTSASSINDFKIYQPGEILVSNGIGNLVVINSSPTGTGSAFTIEEGVFFAKNHFIGFDTQTIILDRYNDKPTCKVGFLINENIIKYTDDVSLLDPALESSNFSAPGADRLQILPILASFPISSTIDLPDFVTLFTISNGQIQTTFDRPQYNIIQDEIAKRTFDESGDYYVNGLLVTLREHLDDGINGGYLSTANGGNSNLISVQISSGTAYVKGYEVSIPPGLTTYLTTDKSSDFNNVNSQIVSSNYGSYVVVDEYVGSWNVDNGTEILLYDTPQNRISSGQFSTGAQTGNNIGTAKFLTNEYNSGTLGTSNGRVNLYITDIKMLGSNNFSDVRSVYYDNASVADMGADIVLDPITGNSVLRQQTNIPIFYTGSDYTKTINPGGSSDTTFYWKTSKDVSISTSGEINLSLPTGASLFPYGTTTLSETQKRDIQISLNEGISLSQPGTISNNGTEIVGLGTTFTKLNPGDKIEISNTSGTYFISSITNATSMTVTSNLSANLSGSNTFSKVYKTGDVIDLSTKGANTSTVRSVSATPTQLTISLEEGYATTKSATITFKVASESAFPASKILREDRYVKINCASNIANTTGPFNLGIPDVIRIKEIRRKTGSDFSSSSEGSNVTSSFIFDDGQRDFFYDHAKITPKISLSSSDYLLVKLDHFEPSFTSGYGFFSIDSYSGTTLEKIPIYKSPTTGSKYNLANYLDFRPVKSSTATSATTVGSATSNPSESSGFNIDSNGMRFSSPSTQIIFDYQYFLSRIDMVVINKNREFTIIRGVPSELAITPDIPVSSMALAKIYVTPYPSLSRFYANQIGRIDLASRAERVASVRQTMRDIGVLKERITNLEYYQSLSILEKSALDMKILDDNGLDRFKNGIFVDNFTDHSLGEIDNLDYRIVVDPIEKCIRPIYTINSIRYKTNSLSGTVQKKDLIFLNYNEVDYFNHNTATTTRNTERTTWRFIGEMDLDPPIDVWVDTQTAPDETFTFGPTDDQISEIEGGITTEWDTWKRTVVGYKAYTSRDNYLGTFSTLAAARSVARAAAIRRYPPGTASAEIEVVYKDERTGTETFTGIDENQQTIGNKVVDIDLNPYIRPQSIRILVRGLKPFAKHYIFFDNISMNEYTTPLTENEYENEVLTSTIFNEGDQLQSDSNGYIWCVLRLPVVGRKFTFGTKEVIITDSPTNDVNDATSFGKSHFVAQGITQTKQDSIITTRSVITTERSVSETREGSDWSVYTWPGSCLAYVINVKIPEEEQGIFVTSWDVYFSEKHPTLGCGIEVREVDNGGGITQNVLPFSKIWLNNSDVNISSDGISNATTVSFDAPIFLENGRSYAFLIRPEAVNPNYYVWISRIGQTDINTGLIVNGRPFTGTLYTTNNGAIWNIVPDADLTCTIRRASFGVGSSGTAILSNIPKDKIILNDTTQSLTRYGEVYNTGDVLTLTSITGNIFVGNVVVSNTTGFSNSIIAIDGSKYYMSNTGFSSGPVTIQDSGGSNVGTATVTSLYSSYGTLEYYKETSNTLTAILNKSTGMFDGNSRIHNRTTGSYSNVSKIENFRYSVIDPEPSFVSFEKTPIKFEFRPYSNTGIQGSYISVEPNENYFFTEEKSVFSRSNEITSLSGANTASIRVTMSTLSDYISPILDVNKTQVLIINNLINSDITGEDGIQGGYLFNKYISRTITLAENQDAEDMKIFATLYRPPNTDVKIWVKFLHAEDNTTLVNREWIEMEKPEGVFSSLVERQDYKEFEFTIPSQYMTGPNGSFEYTSNSGVKFNGYKYFAIKIGLIGDNSAVVPKCSDLRVICVQM